MKKHSHKKPIDAQESYRVRCLIREEIFTKYRDDTEKSKFYRCSKCRKSIIREDRETSNLFKIRGHSHNCPSRQIEIKNEIDEDLQENNLSSDFEDFSDTVLAPATRKASSESNVSENIFSKLVQQLMPSEKLIEKIEDKANQIRYRLRAIVNSCGGLYSNK